MAGRGGAGGGTEGDGAGGEAIRLGVTTASFGPTIRFLIICVGAKCLLAVDSIFSSYKFMNAFIMLHASKNLEFAGIQL